MKAALYKGRKELAITDFSLKEISDSELLVKVGACGICGTDFHIFNGVTPSNPPVIIGHEYACEVISVGKNVANFKEGDRVAINPNIHCGFCDFCKVGKINLCENLRALGVTINGGLAQYSIVPQSQVYIIPNNLPYEHAAFAEPLSCCIHGIKQAKIKIGDTVAIIGAGTIGLLMIQLAKINGASNIIVVEPLEEKHELAFQLGANTVLGSLENENLKNYSSDVVIECAGDENAAETAIKLSKKGGRVLIFGLAANSSFIKINLQEIFHKEITIKTSLLNPFTFQTAIDLLAEKKIKVDSFKTNMISLNEMELKKLFSKNRDSSFIKNMVIPN